MTNLNQETKLKRTLNLPMLIMFGLAYLAPTVVFNYYGIFTADTQGMYTLAILITTVIMLFTAVSYVRMVQAFPVAGSAYTYVNKSVQPHLGFLTGWVMLLDYMLIPMICYLLLGIYINEFFPVLPVWLIVLVVGALGAIINIIGMKTASIIHSAINVLVIRLAVSARAFRRPRSASPCWSSSSSPSTSSAAAAPATFSFRKPSTIR